MKRLVLVRREDPEQRIVLVRWQKWLHGFWGYTAQMILNHRTPCVFPKTVWREEGIK